ncbi:MAG: DNA polymerase/3'-5' exonuclease PolX [Gammaproteobacteria bacterium]|nr:DNA polymerase/3'-5' exonuclease PolX [Gammaproteobacteria bacterium]
MPVHNDAIADMFDRLADLLELEDANPFRVRAYRNAAGTIRGHARPMADLIDAGEDLSKLPDIGDDLAEKIATIVANGKLPLLLEVESRTPAALSDMMKIRGLGPKRVKALYRKLEIRSMDDLRRAARSGKIRELEGFGEKTEQLIRERVERYVNEERRFKLVAAEHIATPLVDHLQQARGVGDVIVAGSLRRRQETIGDLDILVTAGRNSNVMDRFVEYDEVMEVMSKGKTRASVRLRSGMTVDLRVVPKTSYGAALVYFTGSKAHNIALRKAGIKKNLKINEYGVFRNKKRIAGATETSVYEAIGLPVMPPELRENRGELEAARAGRLPRLILLEDIRGDLHCHSNATDGNCTVQEMAEAAVQLGYEYISINDHSQHVTVANGLDKKRLEEQIAAVDNLNDKLDDIVVLKSAEVDILEDGSLDLPDSVLKKLDFTVCAVHYEFNLTRKKQTERVLRAMDNRYFNVLAHPTGRLINEREACDIDLERLMEAARERGCCLEINAHPDRLDLNDVTCKMARDVGVKLVLSTDAHRTSDLGYMRFGIGQARRGWISKSDVINTLPLEKLLKALRRC